MEMFLPVFGPPVIFRRRIFPFGDFLQRVFSPMMTRLLSPAAFFLLLLQMSCAGSPLRVAPERAPEPLPPQVSADLPNKVYDLGFIPAWEGTLQALRETNMPLTEQDRDKGTIRTDYIKDADFNRLDKVFSTRYKYDIFLIRESERRTGLNVRCLYEIKEKDGHSFGNANDLFPDEVISLEKELYRIIESGLRQAEASKAAGFKAEEKEKSPPPAKELAPIPSPAGQKAEAVRPQPEIFLLTKKNAHLRERPSNESKTILVFKPGRKVEKIEESGNWVRVRIWKTTTGWVLKDFLEEAPP